MNIPKLTGQRLHGALKRAMAITLTMLLCFVLMRLAVSGMLVASIASTSFVAFAFPQAESSRPRYLIGGYLCAVATGCLCSWLGRIVVLDVWVLGTQGVFGILAVLLCSALMLLLDLEHPAGVALAISLAVDPSPLFMGAMALICVVILCGVRHLAMAFMARLTKQLETPQAAREETLSAD